MPHGNPLAVHEGRRFGGRRSGRATHRSGADGEVPRDDRRGAETHSGGDRTGPTCVDSIEHSGFFAGWNGAEAGFVHGVRECDAEPKSRNVETGER